MKTYKNGELFDEPKKWRVSMAWASKHIDCTLRGIMKGCLKEGTNCCNHKNFYPPSSNGGKCFHLGEKGCTLTDNDKPIKCLLYPFVIKKDMLVIYGRALTYTCKPNYKKNEISILENMRGNFVALFGEKQYERVYNDVIIKGVNSWVQPTKRLLRQLEAEQILEDKNEIPVPRTTVK